MVDVEAAATEALGIRVTVGGAPSVGAPFFGVECTGAFGIAAAGGCAGRSKFLLRFNGAPCGWAFVSGAGGSGGGWTETTSFTAGTRAIGNAERAGTPSVENPSKLAAGGIDGAVEPGPGFGRSFSGCGSSRSITLSLDEEEAPDCMRS